MVGINSLDNQLNCVLKLLSKQFGSGVFIRDLLVVGFDVVLEGLFLKLCLENSVVNFHDLPLNEILCLLNVAVLNPVSKCALYDIELALFGVARCFV